MPTFQGLVSEEGLVALIEHIKSLSPEATLTPSAAPADGDTPPPADGPRPQTPGAGSGQNE